VQRLNDHGIASAAMLCIAWSLAITPCPSVYAAEKPPAAVTPLRHAHAHNDYEHKRPLFEALEHGFCSVEADVFLKDGQLLVGHTRLDLKPDRTLQKLYLDPLLMRVRANGGRVYPGGPPVYLLIDVKTEATPTYAALDRILADYDEMLSRVRDDKFEPRAITVVVSGNCAREAITAQKSRYAGIDGRPPDLDAEVPAQLIPWVSASWGSLFHWRGEGPMPADERARLDAFVRKAHRHGRLVRFWATPENPAFWKTLRQAGVDLLNTDKLDEMQRFLLENGEGPSAK
jgi:glycerophosphoryl diester phosphodiesterase